ncbi:unnamed protein product [Effrenium voratum]|nr:unnamed protein product [Effrenium voratum]
MWGFLHDAEVSLGSINRQLMLPMSRESWVLKEAAVLSAKSEAWERSAVHLAWGQAFGRRGHPRVLQPAAVEAEFQAKDRRESAELGGLPKAKACRRQPELKESNRTATWLQNFAAYEQSAQALQALGPVGAGEALGDIRRSSLQRRVAPCVPADRGAQDVQRPGGETLLRHESEPPGAGRRRDAGTAAYTERPPFEETVLRNARHAERRGGEGWLAKFQTTEFAGAFRAATKDIPALGSGIHYSASADRLRKLIREGPLKLTDLRERPENFFLAHQLLSEYATQVGPGFGIRFTVQFNLFAGTIIALGNTKQVASLQEMQAQGTLGCFCLTEKLAGVNSGLVVNTTCTWDETKQMFLLHCPDEGAHKNWISQGLSADLAVVVANLIVKGKALGPHGFLMQMRRNGQLVEGVTAKDMGDKTIGNDLDNGEIAFNQVWLPKDSLLDKYAAIENGEYVQRQKGISNMDMIGQRLYTGRQKLVHSFICLTASLFHGTNAACLGAADDTQNAVIVDLSGLQTVEII